MFDAIEKDSTYASVTAGQAGGRGGRRPADRGRRRQRHRGGRAVAIFWRRRDPFRIMTVSRRQARLQPAPDGAKPPIINVPTTPTSAMNRAGTGLKNSELDHRMEYFDPKTRPQAIFLDDGALATPSDLIRSTGTTVFAGLVGARAQLDANPLAAGDEDQAFRLAHRRLPAARRRADEAALRRDLCLAAFLQNRAEDDGLRRFRGGLLRQLRRVDRPACPLSARRPGESTAVVHAAGSGCPGRSTRRRRAACRRVAGVWRDGMDARDAALAVADRLDAALWPHGHADAVRQLDIPREDFPKIAGETVKNFNANAGARSRRRRSPTLRLLEVAY